MTDGLVEFLRARLADDEDWVHHCPSDTDYERCLTTGALTLNNHRALSTVANPLRLQAEVDAKRRIIDWHQQSDDVALCGPEGSFIKLCQCGEEPPCPTLRLLALPYRDHPDYRPEWAPDV